VATTPPAPPPLAVDSVTNTTGFTVASNDLIDGLLPTVVGNLGDQEGLGPDTTGAALTNGLFGPPDLIDGGPNPDVTLIHDGVTLTYTLPNNGGLGYNISDINIYTGWRDGGRVNQDLQILYTTTTNSTFTLLTTVHEAGQSTNPSDLATFVSNVGLTRVTAIQFSFPSTQNGYVGYRELDVIQGLPSAVGGTTTVTNCTVSGNSATVNGGGLYNSALGNTSVSGTNVQHNSAVAGGGIANQGTLNVDSSNLIKNLVTSQGGGISTTGGSATITNSFINANQVNSSGTALGGGIDCENSTLSLTNCTVNANQANGTNAYGGGSYALNSTVIWQSCTVNGNKANGTTLGEGGGIYDLNTVLTLLDTTVNGNKASTDFDNIGP
jgi:hypothetical protein